MVLVVCSSVHAPPVRASGPDSEALRALEQAEACYADLDYACAEERLASALRGTLDPTQQRRARRHEALVALAFHDEPRARRALRALLALDPGFEPAADAPPRLRRLAAQERSVAASAWRVRPWLRAGGGALHLSGTDGELWSDGLRAEAGAGVTLGADLRLELTASSSWHAARIFQLDGLRVAHGGAQAALRLGGDAVGLWGGLGVGAVQVVASGLTGDQRYWGLLVEVPLELTVRLPQEICAIARLAPAVLAVRDGDRAAFSLLLPLSLGLCYQP